MYDQILNHTLCLNTKTIHNTERNTFISTKFDKFKVTVTQNNQKVFTTLLTEYREAEKNLTLISARISYKSYSIRWSEQEAVHLCAELEKEKKKKNLPHI